MHQLIFEIGGESYTVPIIDIFPLLVQRNQCQFGALLRIEVLVQRLALLPQPCVLSYLKDTLSLPIPVQSHNPLGLHTTLNHTTYSVSGESYSSDEQYEQRMRERYPDLVLVQYNERGQVNNSSYFDKLRLQIEFAKLGYVYTFNSVEDARRTFRIIAKPRATPEIPDSEQTLATIPSTSTRGQLTRHTLPSFLERQRSNDSLSSLAESHQNLTPKDEEQDESEALANKLQHFHFSESQGAPANPLQQARLQLPAEVRDPPAPVPPPAAPVPPPAQGQNQDRNQRIPLVNMAQEAPRFAYQPQKYQIDPFTGTSSEEATQFLYTIERAKEMHQWSDQVTRCYFELSMKGIALTWWINNAEELRLLDWAHLRERFEKKFRTIDSESATMEFAGRQQHAHESPIVYLENKVRLQKRANPNMALPELLRWIRKGLSPYYHKETYLLRIETLQELEEILRKIMRSKADEEAACTAASVNYIAPDNLQNSIQQLVAVLTNLHHPDRNSEFKDPRQSQPEQRNPLSNAKCYNCRGYGHYSKDCSSPSNLAFTDQRQNKNQNESRPSSPRPHENHRSRTLERSTQDSGRAHSRERSIEGAWRKQPRAEDNSTRRGNVPSSSENYRNVNTTSEKPYADATFCGNCKRYHHSSAPCPVNDQKNA